MSIKGNFPQNVIDLDAVSVDTVLFDDDNRAAISAMSIHNTTSSDRIISLYISPTLVSTAGERIAVYTIAGDESIDVNELLAQGLSADEQIIGVQDTGGALAGDLNCKLTFVRYTGGS